MVVSVSVGAQTLSFPPKPLLVLSAHLIGTNLHGLEKLVYQKPFPFGMDSSDIQICRKLVCLEVWASEAIWSTVLG